jgi:hypothetical protein
MVQGRAYLGYMIHLILTVDLTDYIVTEIT